MAYIHALTVGNVFSDEVTPLALDNAIGDGLIYVQVQDSSSDITSIPSGWSEYTTDNNAHQGVRIQVLYKRATSTDEIPPTFTDTTSEGKGWAYVVVKDIPAAGDIFDDTWANLNKESTSGASFTSAAYTTSEDDVLLLHIVGQDRYPGHFISDLMKLGYSLNQNNAGIQVYSGWKATAGAIDTFTVHSSEQETSSHENAVHFVLPIRSEEGKEPAYLASAPATNISNINDAESTIEGPIADGMTEVTVLGTTQTIDDLSTNGSYSNLYTLVNGNVLLDGFSPGTTQIHTSGTGNGSTVLNTAPFASRDLAGKLLAVRFQNYQGENAAATVEGGILFGVRSVDASNSPYKMFMAASGDGVPSLSSGAVTSVVFSPDSTDTSVANDAAGTFDSSAIDGVCVGFKSPTAGGYGSEMRVAFANFAELHPMEILGGNTDAPLDWTTFQSAASAAGHATVYDQSGLTESQVGFLQPVKIGASAGNVNFQVSSTSVVFGEAADPNTGKIFSYVTEDQLGLEVYGSTSDIIKLENSVIAFGNTRGYFITTGDTDCTWGFSGTLVSGANVTLADLGTAYSGMKFSNCSKLDDNVNLSNVTIDASSALTGAIEVSYSSVSDLNTKLNALGSPTVTNNTIGLRLIYTGDLGNAGSQTIVGPDGLLFSGNTVDIHLESATHEVDMTFNVGSGSTPSTTSVSGHAGNSLVLSNDVPFTVNLEQVGGELTILSTGTQTIQLEAETSGSSEVFTFTAPLGTNVDIQYLLPGYLPFWESNRDLGTIASSLTINLEVDPAYA